MNWKNKITAAFLGLLFNMAFGAYHILAGYLSGSRWLMSVGAYYALLSVVRFVLLRLKSDGENGFAERFAGMILTLLTLPLAVTVVLAVAQDRGVVQHKIVMIAMAAYAFTKISLAAVNLIKVRRGASGRAAALRNLSFADACVSIFALQRSMLVSFGGMSGAEIRIMNACTGTAVCLTALLLGIHLLRRAKRRSHGS